MKSRNNIDLFTLLIIMSHMLSQKDMRLRFNSVGQFKILVMTDLHLEGNSGDQLTIQLIYNLITQTRPDIVILNGDSVSGYKWDGRSKDFFKNFWLNFTRPFIDLQVRYALVLGNHDQDADLSFEQVLILDSSNPFSLFKQSWPNFNRFGDYVLPIYSSFPGHEEKTTALLWMFNTRARGCDEFPESWGCLIEEQHRWFLEKSKSFNEKEGRTVNGLSFFHIPLPEIMYLFNYGKTYGSKGEWVCCPKKNKGSFEILTSLNSIKGIFSGHDHVNDYGGFYKGVFMAYVRKTGFGSYGPRNLHGGMVITLKENLSGEIPNFEFRTETIEENGNVIKHDDLYYQGLLFPQFNCSFVHLSTIVLSVLGAIITHI